MIHKVILGTLSSMLMRVILNPSFLEWAIMYSARKLAEYTNTPHDDAFVTKIEELLAASKKEPQ